jgi:transcription-repair coupling factor (superfamily II helicase)
VLVPRPSTAGVGGTPLRDVELLAWAEEFVDAVLLATPASARSA